jgi:hypothetical protein
MSPAGSLSEAYEATVEVIGERRLPRATSRIRGAHNSFEDAPAQGAMLDGGVSSGRENGAYPMSHKHAYPMSHKQMINNSSSMDQGTNDAAI